MNPEWIGLMAAFFTTAAYVPQAMKVLRERHTASLSLGMYVMMTTGLGLWFIYGVMLGSLALILANGITMLLAATIMIMKIRLG